MSYYRYDNYDDYVNNVKPSDERWTGFLSTYEHRFDRFTIGEKYLLSDPVFDLI